MFQLVTIHGADWACSLYPTREESADWAALWRGNWPEGSAVIAPYPHAPEPTMPATYTPADLFNCCHHGTAPDWAGFRSLYVGGCIDHDGHTEGGVSADRAQFFTVYARDADGLAEAITDTPTGATLAEAVALAAHLSGMSGLPVELCPSLDPANHETGERATVRLFAPCPAAVVDPDAAPPMPRLFWAGLGVLIGAALALAVVGLASFAGLAVMVAPG